MRQIKPAQLALWAHYDIVILIYCLESELQKHFGRRLLAGWCCCCGSEGAILHITGRQNAAGVVPWWCVTLCHQRGHSGQPTVKYAVRRLEARLVCGPTKLKARMWRRRTLRQPVSSSRDEDHTRTWKHYKQLRFKIRNYFIADQKKNS